MNYTPLNKDPYLNGIWKSWSADGVGVSSAYVTDGEGVSSAYVRFVFNSSAPSTSSNLAFDVNVTTAAILSGNYQINGILTQANLTVNILNEGKPALAQNFTFYFENAIGGWVKVGSSSITDFGNFGNGTYSVSFTTETDQSSNPLLVSMLCQDQRGIFVGANVTCSNIA